MSLGTEYGSNSLVSSRATPTGRVVVIVSGAGKLDAGAVMGKITADGKYMLSASGASDGSQTPSVILAEGVDATEADVEATVYTSGIFIDTGLTFGEGHSVDTVWEALRDKSIQIIKGV